MDTYKEFQAKTVDQAIDAACRFYDVPRESLEIDIVSGGSSGIFGLGAKKASIRARRRRPAGQESAPAPAPAPQPEEVAAQPVREVVSPADEELSGDDFDDEETCTPAAVAAEDLPRLEADIRKVVGTLLRALGSDGVLTVDASGSPIGVHIDDEENSGLIIGRDGQTITALQYLTNRIVSKTWAHSPRIQLDAGDYRQKQESQLQSIALFLSEKAKKTGRVQSTKPLSSFHRRVVHMALQHDKGVMTRSKGEGAMKRVLILPVKRGKTGHRPTKRQEPAQARQS